MISGTAALRGSEILLVRMRPVSLRVGLVSKKIGLLARDLRRRPRSWAAKEPGHDDRVNRLSASEQQVPSRAGSGVGLPIIV